MRSFLAATGILTMAACSAPNSLYVSEDSIENYPLTVPGRLYCRNGAVWIETADGQTWQVNGAARASHQAIDPIWKQREDMPGLRVSISPLIEAGLKLCQ